MRTLVAALALVVIACGSEDAEPKKNTPSGPPWQPGVVYRTPEAPNARGLLDRRGLVHAHSAYSHDACDDDPLGSDGLPRPECLDDFREGVCKVAHDFVFLTDHGTHFAEFEYPDVLLHRPDEGDTLVERGGAPVANRLACPDAPPALVMAGTETGFMPVGIEHHLGATPDERKAAYDLETPEGIEALKAAGAVVLAQHTEDWTVDQLATLPLDGFEMYNLHANTITGAGGLFSLLGKQSTPEALPHPDLSLLAIVNEDDRYLSRWGGVLARGVKRTTTIGTDCHQNVLQDELPDGERMDSYRRMMIWMSNHLLVRPTADGSISDLELKEALRAGRLYGAFEVLGYPFGFEFVGDSAGQIAEIGDSVAISAGVVLRVVRPSVERLDPEAEPPEITVRLLRALDDGWELVAENTGDVEHTPTVAGAYRAEVRMRPRHLAGHLSSYVDLAEQDFVWILSNAIYVE